MSGQSHPSSSRPHDWYCDSRASPLPLKNHRSCLPPCGPKGEAAGRGPGVRVSGVRDQARRGSGGALTRRRGSGVSSKGATAARPQRVLRRILFLLPLVFPTPSTVFSTSRSCDLLSYTNPKPNEFQFFFKIACIDVVNCG